MCSYSARNSKPNSAFIPKAKKIRPKPDLIMPIDKLVLLGNTKLFLNLGSYIVATI